MIEVHKLEKYYDKRKVLDIASFLIHSGECVGLVGNNGAGKTTFMRLMLDLLEATSGQVLNRGVNVADSEEWKQDTAAFLGESFLIPYLTAPEYLEFIAKTYGMPAQDVSHFFEEMKVFLGDDIIDGGKLIQEYSQGNQSKIGIAGALLARPQLLLLDEPFAHLDPRSQAILRDNLKHRNRHSDMTIVVSSHDLKNVSSLCTRIIVIDNGRIVKDLETDAQTLTELEDYFKPEWGGGV